MYGNSPISSISDEKERKAAEDRAQQAALRLQRKQRLEALIRKRKANVEYLKKFHEGGCLWLNSTRFTSDDLRKYLRVAVPKQRTQSYFMLGMSLARILYLPGGLPTVRAVAQLIEEWEYYHSGTAMQSMKYMMAKNSPCIYPQTVALEGVTDLAKPTIFKFNSSVVYEYLDTTHIALELDYIEVFIALCDTLRSIYGKLFHEETFGNQAVYDTAVRLDARIKHHVINMVAKELTELSNRRIKASTQFIRSLSHHRSSEIGVN